MARLDTGTADLMCQVAQVKAKIEKEKGWEVSQQKLIYSGKCFPGTPTELGDADMRAPWRQNPARSKYGGVV